MPLPDINEHLTASRNGDKSALDKVLPIVYAELRRLARYSLAKERPDHTLQPTALVHETYLRLTGQREVDWSNRAHFMAIAATMMRRILATYAESRNASKRGGGVRPITVDLSVEGAPATNVDLLAVHEALDRLGGMDEQQARIVEMRYMGGLTIEETAEVLSVSPATVKREWTLARAWLLRELGRPAR